MFQRLRIAFKLSHGFVDLLAANLPWRFLRRRTGLDDVDFSGPHFVAFAFVGSSVCVSWRW